MVIEIAINPIASGVFHIHLKAKNQMNFEDMLDTTVLNMFLQQLLSMFDGK